MGRKPRDRSPEEKWQIVQEGINKRERLGDVSTVTGSLRICSIAGTMKRPSRPGEHETERSSESIQPSLLRKQTGVLRKSKN